MGVRELNIFTVNLKKRQAWENKMNELIENAEISREAFVQAIDMLKEAYHNDRNDPIVKKYFTLIRKYIWPKDLINNHDSILEENLNHVPQNIKDGDEMLEGLKANYDKFQQAFATMINQNQLNLRK